MLLLVASCLFYMAFIPRYLLILFFLIGLDFGVGIALERSSVATTRKLILVASLVANIATLGVFKYYNFFAQNLNQLLASAHLTWAIASLAIVLPIGLSFHTFQSMAYTIEVYRKNWPAERHLGIYALYVLFYPQLVAGPIERPSGLLPQLHAEHSFDLQRVADGLALMLWGFIKKVVIADRLALYVNRVYEDPAQSSTSWLVIATYLFAFQIYCDFSGYSDIAIGAAQVMGIRLMDNFNRPYAARSVSEFWKRWHISLSSWFRDYLYIPLGGNRRGPLFWCANIMVVFVVSGFWHGAAWKYVVWGALHGTYLIAGHFLRPMRESMVRRTPLAKHPRLRVALQVVMTFHLVLLAWVFFRAANVRVGANILRRIFDGSLIREHTFLQTVMTPEVLGCLAAIGFLELIHWLERHKAMRHQLRSRPRAIRWAYYYAMLLILLNFGMFTNPSEFIYFQF
jgi:alginate O-acetyltransferase complex protein AlgI